MKFINDTEEFLENLLHRLAEAFCTHKSVDEFHVTADGQLFAEKNHADAQAQRLRERGVATITRDDVEKTTAAKAEAAVSYVAGDPSLLHPEATIPTPEEIAVKQAADEKASADLKAKLDGTYVEPTPPATEPETDSAPAESTETNTENQN